MIELETMPQLIEQRQAYLRSLAAHQPVSSHHGPVRQRAGRLLVRFGRWVEGRYPDERGTTAPAFPAASPGLAGSAK